MEIGIQCTVVDVASLVTVVIYKLQKWLGKERGWGNRCSWTKKHEAEVHQQRPAEALHAQILANEMT